jgi:5-methyltetrahydropteroyltriglutamate--homocysteine methyltransferase
MKILSANHSSYPRIGESPKEQVLRKAITLWEKGELPKEKLVAVEDEVTKEVIEEQLACGIDIPTDGQVRWYDPISHIVKNLGGIRIDGLLRFFDTNFYFRQPVIENVKEAETGNFSLTDEYLFAKNVFSSIKPVLTGPYTIACLSVIRGIDFSEVVMFLAKKIAQEVKRITMSGAKVIQIDEPCILKNPTNFLFAKNALDLIAKENPLSKFILSTYFGNGTSFYEKLQELPVWGLGFDLTYSPGLLKKIEILGTKKVLSLGIVDARNTKLEKPEELARLLEKTILKLKFEVIYLTTSCGLEFVPRSCAKEKLKILSKTKKLLTK